MATPEQIAFFRNNLGDNGTPPAFGEADIDQIYLELSEDYPTALRPETNARAILAGIRILLVDAAKLVTYKQNQSTENASDIFKALNTLYDRWVDELGAALNDASSAGAGWGALAGGRPHRQLGRPLSPYTDISRNRRC